MRSAFLVKETASSQNAVCKPKKDLAVAQHHMFLSNKEAFLGQNDE